MGYVVMLLRSLMKKEDPFFATESAEWLQEVRVSGRKRVKVDQRWGDLERVRIQVGGEFHIVERSNMIAAFGANYNDDVNDNGYIVQRRNEVEYRDYEPESAPVHLNLARPQIFGALPTSARVNQSMDAQRPAITNEQLQELVRLRRTTDMLATELRALEATPGQLTSAQRRRANYLRNLLNPYSPERSLNTSGPIQGV